MDVVADRIDRSKSWIVRQAVSEWLDDEQRRHELTLEALKPVVDGRTIPHEEALAWLEQRKRERRARPAIDIADVTGTRAYRLAAVLRRKLTVPTIRL